MAHGTGDWKPPNDFMPDNPEFTGSPGIQLDWLTTVQLHLRDDILGDIVTQTNIYAAQYLTLNDQSLIARKGRIKKIGKLPMLMDII
ncbi:Hypothetical predicted protein [Pelobates cultripes]|uniref:Uncharacterized protein n=1 Tax=Pelobates cultripes TaxID=61616 RepID=A0AAD1VWL5_PELCU|nr:Hypothetical predicted protein [Pelobates cultripes]